jgi:hypothetical protein
VSALLPATVCKKYVLQFLNITYLNATVLSSLQFAFNIN